MVSNEELISILLLQVTCNVQTSLKIFSQSEEPTQPDSFCHNFCEIYQPASVDNEISNVGCYLVLQLKYFVNYNGNFIIKHTEKVPFTERLYVPVLVDGVSFHKTFNHIATENHAITLDKGHTLLKFCTVEGLGYFSLSLGASTLHITLFMLLYMVKVLLNCW